ncbi:hypothetical protein BGZ74_009732 [Mortierella antarctica]|nr:hypothetical protein BGZ74_009732 [Mortierella antarctica]
MECTFNVFEAPGFRAAENLQRKILAIYKTAVESQIDVHHVLVTLAPDPDTSLAPNPVAGLAFSPITSTTRTFISGFSNLFPNIFQHMTFVHTKVDYRHLHISNTLFRDSIKDKEEQIRRLTKKSLSIIMIDASQHAEQPIQEAMSQNVDLYTRFDNKEDYEDLLNARGRDYTTAISLQDPSSQHQLQLVEFKFLDTPGLNDTKYRDVIFARMIVDEIIRIQSFNLILVLVSGLSPISPEYGFALEYYSKILEGLHSKIAFLYTKIDYADCHQNTMSSAVFSGIAAMHQLDK